jgi:hypothetical protein
MPPDKILQIYPTFEDWVHAHKHSSSSVQWALRDAFEAEPNNPANALKLYISSLGELHSEIKTEIAQARYWISRFRKHKG